MPVARNMHEAGFTLLEMLVVLVIIGLIMGLVGQNLLKPLETGNVTAAKTQIKMLETALEAMSIEIGRFPTKEEGLDLLNNPPKDERLARRWNGPYLKEPVPLDPWGNPYIYAPETSTYVELYSLGADGRPGGEGVNADIGYLPRTKTQP